MGKESETESFNPLSADEQLDLFNQMSAVLRRGGLRGLQLGKGEVENVYRMRATILQLNESVAWSQRSVAAYEKDKAELQSALSAATEECERLRGEIALERASNVRMPIKRVEQTTPRNCGQACLAMVLEVPIDEVPKEASAEFWDANAVQEWLSTWGLQEIRVRCFDQSIWPANDVRCIVDGPSPRGEKMHAVVCTMQGPQGWVLDADPHPDNNGLADEPYSATFFAVKNPAEFIRLQSALAAKDAEIERLTQYRARMEEAHGEKLYAIEHLLDHFDEEGNIKGDGQWRIRAIWQCCKDFDEGSERAAQLSGKSLLFQLAECSDVNNALIAECAHLKSQLAAKDAMLAAAVKDKQECLQYHAPRIAELERLLHERQEQCADLVSIIGDIEQIRSVEGHSVTIVCDNPESDDIDEQSAVDAVGDFTGWEEQRFYGKTWRDALLKAANLSRRHNAESYDQE